MATSLGQRYDHPDGEDKDTVVGTWKLVTIETFDASGRLIVDANQTRGRGENPAGLLTYTSAGIMSVQIVPTGRKLSTDREISGAEAQAVLKGFSAYFGTYTVKPIEGVVIHHLESHTNPNLIGTDYTRHYKVVGNRLTLQLPPVMAGNVEKNQRLVWVRVGVAGKP